MRGAGRKGPHRTACFRGHPLTPETTRISTSYAGWAPTLVRECRVCVREQRRRRRQRPEVKAAEAARKRRRYAVVQAEKGQAHG